MNIRERFLWYLCSCEKRFDDYSNNIMLLFSQGKRIIGSTRKNKPHEYVMNYVLYLLHVHNMKIRKNIVVRSLMASFVFRDIDIDKDIIRSVINNIKTKVNLCLYFKGKTTLDNLEKSAHHCYVDFDSTYLLCQYHDILNIPINKMNFQSVLKCVRNKDEINE
ncbi:MAG: hypothetical protein CMB64_05295 [Euryarchaeota archaeon]|nr:hypothetical protein [Euryarchaeota archaeon]